MKIRLTPKDALIVVDVQKDFCPGGALPVPEGDKVVPTLNEYIRRFVRAGALVLATRDWHPANHTSFKEQGGIWPAHCVQDSDGAQFHPQLQLPEDVTIISKATRPDQEAYSGFEGTDLSDRLRQLSVRRVFVGGLATDYCVKSTVLDALKLGFTTFWLEDASKGVEVNPGDCAKAVEEMLAQGAISSTLDELE